MAPATSTDSLQDLPERVRAAQAFLERHGVWHVVARNSPATSCLDAAARRRRLGREGIPLYDELRSFCGVYYSDDENGRRRVVLLHCRANALFDLDAAATLLGTSRRIARLSPDELSEMGSVYGTVNPFTASMDLVQVFDEDVLESYTPPHSMMTNAGDHTWAVEFRPKDVIAALSSAGVDVRVGRIATRPPDPVRIPVFGILTGNGPESGMALWRHINQVVHSKLTAERRMRGDLSYPKVIVHSLPEMGLSMELKRRSGDVWEVIATAIHHLRTAGATHIAIACNTTQFFADKIRGECAPDMTFVSMVDVVSGFIARENLDDVTIVGIPAVAALGEWSGYRPLLQLGVRPVDASAEANLEELAYLVKRLDDRSPDNASLNRLQNVLRSGVPTGRVIIALTEISVLLERYPKLKEKIGGKAIIDPLRLTGESMAEIYLSALPVEKLHEGGANEAALASGEDAES